MIVDANDMLADFNAVINEVTEFAGLPEHSYIYDSSREHKTGCDGRDRRVGNNYFVPGGRFVNMIQYVLCDFYIFVKAMWALGGYI